MSKLVLAFKTDNTFYQVHVGEGYTFDRANMFTAFVKDKKNRETAISLLLDHPFTVVKKGSPGYISGFESTSDQAACDKAVPSGTTMVVIEGKHLENAIVFPGNGGFTAVQKGGKFRVVSDQPGVAIGDNATVVNINFGKFR